MALPICQVATHGILWDNTNCYDPSWVGLRSPARHPSRARLLVGLSISVALLFEALEPDELSPIALPLDDLARKVMMKQARQALAEGGEAGLRKWVRNAFGEHGNTVLRWMDDVIGVVCSFSADTPVSTAVGLIPIGEIQEGDVVLAYNAETGEIGYYPVTAVWGHEDAQTVTLTIEGETVETTPEHPFYVVGGTAWQPFAVTAPLAFSFTVASNTAGRWVVAGELWPGAAIMRADGTTGIVEALHVVSQPQVMYNLTVAEAHTYFVGDGQWLVHNACRTTISKNGRIRLDYGDWVSDEFDVSATVSRIKRGDTSFHPRDGTLFRNPTAKGLPAGRYTEWTVDHPKYNGLRILYNEDTGQYFFTEFHYQQGRFFEMIFDD